MNDLLKPITLCYGIGKEGESACWMAALSQFLGYGHKDKLKCASPIINEFCVAINDVFGNTPDGQANRTRVIIDGGYLFAPVGTLDPDNERRREYILIDAAIRQFAPLALRATGSPTLIKHAEVLESLPEVVDETTRRNCESACMDAAAAAESAPAAAAFAATTTAAVTTAAYAFCANDNDRSKFIENVCLPVLDRMLAAGKHAPRESVPPIAVEVSKWYAACGVK